jgi:hypothetical protein
MRNVKFKIIAGAFAGLLIVSGLRVCAADMLPREIADGAFWQLVDTLSEPAGEFHSENFLSNESGFQAVIPMLQQRIKPDGVYLGVGPEQSFTYIVALRPKMAFIIDIRRQNMMEHLIYKALFELSPNRAEFVSRLFSRTRPAGLNDGSSANDLFAAYRTASVDEAAFQKNLQEIENTLQTKHNFNLTKGDLADIEHVYTVFRDYGPDIRYDNSSSRNAGGIRGGGFGGGRRNGLGRTGTQFRGMPDYADLMTATDLNGAERSYLANEQNYRFLRNLEVRNLIVPLTGDFGGTKALHAVGQYVRDHSATVTAFYLSNVEQYLFQNGSDQNGGWRNFYANVATLPLDATSTFIRSGGRGAGGVAQGFNGRRGGGMRSNVLASIQETLAAVKAGRIQAYNDVFSISR